MDNIDWYNKGKELYNQEKYNEAIHYYNKFITFNPSQNNHAFKFLAYYYVGLCFFNLKRYSEANTHFEKSQNIFKEKSIISDLPACDDTFVDYYLYYNQGLVLNSLQEYGNAIIMFTESIKLCEDRIIKETNDFRKSKLNEDCGFSYFARGISYGHIKNYSKAKSDFDKILKIYCNNLSQKIFSDHFIADVLRNKAFVMARLGGSKIFKIQMITDCFKEALILAPDSPYMWNSLGFTFNILAERIKYNSSKVKNSKYQDEDKELEKLWKTLSLNSRKNDVLEDTNITKIFDISDNINQDPKITSKEYIARALKCFDKAIENNEGFASAWRNKGYSLKALANITKDKNIFTSFSDIKDTFKDIENIFKEAEELDKKFSLSLYAKGYIKNEKNYKKKDIVTKIIKNVLFRQDKDIDNSKATKFARIIYDDIIHGDNESNESDILKKEVCDALRKDKENKEHYVLYKELITEIIYEIKRTISEILYEDALRCIEISIRIYKNHAYAWEYKNHAYAWEYKNHAYAWNYKGYIYFELASLFSYDPEKKKENYNEALKCFDHALGIDSQNADAWNYKGISLDMLNRYREAVDCFDNAISIYKNIITNYEHNVDAWHNLSDVWNFKGRSLDKLKGFEYDAIECFDNAIECYEKTKEISKIKYGEEIDIQLEKSDAEHNKGYTLGRLGEIDIENYKNAFSKFSDAIECKRKLQSGSTYDKSLSDSYRNRAFVRYKLINSNYIIEQNTNNIKAKNSEYKSSFEDLDPMSDYENAIKTDPTFALAWNSLGYFILISSIKSEKNNFEKYLQDYYFTKNGSVVTKDKNKNDCMFNYQAKVKEYLENTNNKLSIYDLAIICFDNAIRSDLDKLYAHPFYNKGYVYYYKALEESDGETSKYEKLLSDAKKCFDNAIKIKFNFTYALNNKGYACNSLGNYYEAIECFEKAAALKIDTNLTVTEIEPSIDYASKARAYSLYSIDRFRDAIEFFEKAKENNLDNKGKKRKELREDLTDNHSDDFEAIYYEGDSYFKLNNFTKSIDCYNIAKNIMEREKNSIEEYDIKMNLLYLKRGGAFYMNGDYGNALKDFDKVKDPKYEAQIHNNIGLCYHRLNLLDNAEEEYTLANKSPQKILPEAYYNLGILYNDKNKPEMARTMLELCQKYDESNNLKANDAINKLQNVNHIDWINYWFEGLTIVRLKKRDNKKETNNQQTLSKQSKPFTGIYFKKRNILKKLFGSFLYISAILLFINTIINPYNLTGSLTEILAKNLNVNVTGIIVQDLNKNPNNSMNQMIILFVILLILIGIPLLPMFKRIKVGNIEMDTAPPIHEESKLESGKLIDYAMPTEYYPLEHYTAPVVSNDLNTLRFYEPFPMPLQYPLRCFSLPLTLEGPVK